MRTPSCLLSPVSCLLEEGLAAHQAGKLDVAEARYREILRRTPAQPDAVHLLGVVALQTERLAEADTLIRRALTLAPEQPTFWNSLGVLQRTQGQLSDSAASFAQAVAFGPDYVDGWANLVGIRETLGERAGEAAALEHLTRLLPGHARGWGRLGILAADAGRLEAAAALLERAATLAPDDAEVWSSLGTIQLRLGRLDEAVTSQHRALALQPENTAMMNNLGSALVARGDWQEAADLLARGVALAPADANGWTNLGHALKGLRRLDEAAHCYARALDQRPADAETYQHLGITLQVLGRLPEAIAAYRQSLALIPDQAAIHSALIFTLDLLEGAEVEAGQERARWNARFGPKPGAILPHLNDRHPDRPLRVGYVSADFLNHSAGFIALPILQSHDHTRVSVVCYSGVRKPDAMTARFQAAADLWHDVADLSDDDLAALIRADQIDVLVDLSGHSAGNRLPVFARKPAPVQITAWGYATGTGLSTMDYFLADPIVVPAEAHHAYTETVVNLPNVVCYTLPVTHPDVAPAPMLSRGQITFGAFNRLSKVSPGAVAAWARVLAAVPTAHLIVKTGSQDTDAARQRLLADLEALGVSRERVEVRRGTSQFEHLAAHADIDVMLDTFPHTGGITSLEAILMGVPTVTLLGERVAGRLSASFLAALGLDRLVARTLDEYVAIATEVAASPAWLEHERATLRARLLASPIADVQRYTRAVEETYQALWQRWRDEETELVLSAAKEDRRQESGARGMAS
jgi:predicted O-linked N-acetylglucosamine transferase (SPINDLY family)